MTTNDESYLEVGHRPVAVSRRWPQEQLLVAAQKSVCRNTGWPIGVVLTKPELAPKPVSDGIRAVIRTALFPNSFDFWSLDRNGSFYFLRAFEEDTKSHTETVPGTVLYFDIRIWRIAEALLHCANLYRALDMSNETEIGIQIAHHGLKDRKLLASDPMRAMTMAGRVCYEQESIWSKVVPVGTIEPNLETLVEEISSELFILFEFWNPDPSAWKTVLQAFLNSRT
jgi:hypothetical protein